MKPVQFYLLVILGAGCLILTIVGIALGHSNQKLQGELQQQQEEINRGNASQQVGTNILRDIAQGAANDEKLRDVLRRAGYTLQVTNPAASGTTSSTSGTDSSPSPKP